MNMFVSIPASRLLPSAATLDKRAERALFSSLRMDGGIFKTTVAGRLRDLDAATNVVVSTGPALRQVLDVGVSSGTTSLEWLEALATAGSTPRMTATDLSLKALLVEPWRGYQVLIDRTGRPLQHVIGGTAIRSWCRRLDYVTQNWIVVVLANALFARAAATGAIDRARPAATPLFLVAPQVAAHPAITLEEDDVFAAPPPAHVARFDAVRVANLLLPGVFGEDRVRRGIAGLKPRLAGAGALFIVARTDPGGANHATIFRLGADERLVVVRRVGAGSEIEPLVLAT